LPRFTPRTRRAAISRGVAPQISLPPRGRGTSARCYAGGATAASAGLDRLLRRRRRSEQIAQDQVERTPTASADAFLAAGNFGFGTGSSPVLADGRLFVRAVLFVPGKSSWCTPLVWKTKQRTEVVACGDKRVISYDPATGKVLWELGRLPRSTPNLRPSPCLLSYCLPAGCA
jgi:hypothetical protein